MVAADAPPDSSSLVPTSGGALRVAVFFFESLMEFGRRALRLSFDGANACAAGKQQKEAPMKIRSVLAVCAFAAAIAPAFAASGSSNRTAAAPGGVRLACAAAGAQDFSADARFEDRRGRRKFDASFEAAPNLGFLPGQRLSVAVGGVTVGQMTLARDPVNGDVIGDLEFDSRPDERVPFPTNFPAVGSGTGVVIGPLGCALN
jgi:hypothetical protein